MNGNDSEGTDDRVCLLWVQKDIGRHRGPRGPVLGFKWLRTHCRTASGPNPEAACVRLVLGDSGTYLQNQLPGGRGHEDAVTPRRAPSVHVLPALAGVLAVRVAGGTQGRLVSCRLCPTSHCPPSPRGSPCGSSHAHGVASATQGKNPCREVSRTQSQTSDLSSPLNFSCNGLGTNQRYHLGLCGFSFGRGRRTVKTCTGKTGGWASFPTCIPGAVQRMA